MRINDRQQQIINLLCQRRSDTVQNLDVYKRQHEYSANFLFTLWKRVRKYGACCTGLTQNVDDLLQSHTCLLYTSRCV